MFASRIQWIILLALSLLATYATWRHGPEPYIGWARLHVAYFLLAIVVIGLYFRLGASVYGTAVGLLLGYPIGAGVSGLFPSASILLHTLVGFVIGTLVELVRKRNRKLRQSDPQSHPLE